MYYSTFRSRVTTNAIYTNYAGFASFNLNIIPRTYCVKVAYTYTQVMGLLIHTTTDGDCLEVSTELTGSIHAGVLSSTDISGDIYLE